MRLEELVMRGAEIRGPGMDPVPVDFVVSSSTHVFLGETFWWENNYALGTGIQIIEGVLERIDDATWEVKGRDLVLTTPSDAEVAHNLQSSRARMDMGRPGYLRELALAREAFEDGDWEPWLQAVMDRPRRDPAEEYRQNALALRSVGILEALGPAGSVVDVLVIDERGEAATYREDGWFASFAEQWMEYQDDERPTIEEFLVWLAKQRPYGDLSLGSPRFDSKEGPVADMLRTQQAATA